jgi:hypothetical protein
MARREPTVRPERCDDVKAPVLRRCYRSVRALVGRPVESRPGVSRLDLKDLGTIPVCGSVQPTADQR